jgi:hypothetical protein
MTAITTTPIGPPRHGLRDPFPDLEPALVLSRREDARERALQVPDVRQQEEADEENGEGREKDAEEGSRDSEYGRDRVGYRDRNLLGPRLDVVRGAAVAEPERPVESRSSETVCGRSWRKSRTLLTSGTSRSRKRT